MKEEKEMKIDKENIFDRILYYEDRIKTIKDNLISIRAREERIKAKGLWTPNYVSIDITLIKLNRKINELRSKL